MLESAPSPHAFLDALAPADAYQAVFSCCGARRFAALMLEQRPFGSAARLLACARAAYSALAREDLLEAFSAHPVIGEDPEALRAKFAGTAAWSSAEQAGVGGAPAELLAELAAQNRAYRERFGFIFIICASGKSASDMLSALNSRLGNAEECELAIAAAEQEKIMLLRLEKLGR